MHGIVLLLRQGKELLLDLGGMAQCSLHAIIHRQALQHLEEVRVVLQLLAQIAGSGVDLVHIQMRIPLGH